jgi:hypothetical protein
MRGSTYVTTPVEGADGAETKARATRALFLLGGSDYCGDALQLSDAAIEAIEDMHASGLYGRSVADTAHLLLLAGLRAELAELAA